MEFEDAQMFLAAAVEIDPEIEPGGFIEEPMENAGFGRSAAQTAKQVIVGLKYTLVTENKQFH